MCIWWRSCECTADKEYRWKWSSQLWINCNCLSYFITVRGSLSLAYTDAKPAIWLANQTDYQPQPSSSADNTRKFVDYSWQNVFCVCVCVLLCFVLFCFSSIEMVLQARIGVPDQRKWGSYNRAGRMIGEPRRLLSTRLTLMPHFSGFLISRRLWTMPEDVFPAQRRWSNWQSEQSCTTGVTGWNNSVQEPVHWGRVSSILHISERGGSEGLSKLPRIFDYFVATYPWTLFAISRCKSTQVLQTRTCIRPCEGWPNGFASRLASRKFYVYTVDLWSNCVDLHWVAKRWKACIDLRINLSLTKVNASPRRWVDKRNVSWTWVDNFRRLASVFGQGFSND